MPTFKENKGLKGLFTTKQLQLAVACAKDGMSFRQAAEKFGVPLSTLARYTKRERLQGVQTKLSMSTAQVFTSDEEDTLQQYIIQSSKLSSRLTKMQTRQLAYKFAKLKNIRMPTSWVENEAAGEVWLLGFRKRAGNLAHHSPVITRIKQKQSEREHSMSNEHSPHERKTSTKPGKIIPLHQITAQSYNCKRKVRSIGVGTKERVMSEDFSCQVGTSYLGGDND